MTSPDPYATLGISPAASDAELRAAYRRLVQLHHPDHNGGSRDSALRFEAVQAAYAQIRAVRATAPPHAARGRQAPPYGADPRPEARRADMEEELRPAQAAGDRARQAVREAAAQAEPRPRATDEE